jgi:hypothetical protein
MDFIQVNICLMHFLFGIFCAYNTYMEMRKHVHNHVHIVTLYMSISICN